MSVNVNYGEYHQLIAPKTVEALRTRRHYLGANNAYPFQNDMPVLGNFEQQCAKKRFNDLVEKYKQATGLQNATAQEVIGTMGRNMSMQAMMSVMESVEIEMPHRKELEDLAVQIVREDFNIKEGDVIFDVHIVGLNVQFPPEMKTEEEDMFEPPPTLNYDADDEVQKRRFINALISGASKKGHYIFHLGRPQLDRINPQLIPIYQLMMSSNDLLYYVFPDSFAQMAASEESQSNHAGYEKLSFNADGIPVITVEAVNFPTLLHEIIKGVLELISTLALPDDKALLEYVYDEADFVMAEMWYLRLGPIFWERLMDCFPTEHMDIKSLLLGKIFELPTVEFNLFMQSALSTDNTQNAISQLNTWAREIKDKIRSYNQRNM